MPDHSSSTDERDLLAQPSQSSSPLECTSHLGFSLGYAGAVMMALGLVLYLLLGAISLFWSVQPWLSYLEG